MRRLFGPRANAFRQDVKLAADLDPVSEGEDFAAWVAYREARKEKRKGKGDEARSKTGRGRPKGEGRALNGFNCRTGER